MDNIIEVVLKVEGNPPLSELVNRVTKELEGKYEKDKDILNLRDFSRKASQIRLIYEVFKGKESSSPIKEGCKWTELVRLCSYPDKIYLIGEKLMVEKNIFSCTWDEFEDWIREQINGNFSWKIRPRDTKENREAIAESILRAIRENNNSFPSMGDMFIEKLIEKN